MTVRVRGGEGWTLRSFVVMPTGWDVVATICSGTGGGEDGGGGGRTEGRDVVALSLLHVAAGWGAADKLFEGKVGVVCFARMNIFW